MIKHYKVADQPGISGIREMVEADVPQVRELLNKFLNRYDVAPVFQTDDDVKHWILPHKDVVWTYVVEVREDKEKRSLRKMLIPFVIIRTLKPKRSPTCSRSIPCQALSSIIPSTRP